MTADDDTRAAQAASAGIAAYWTEQMEAGLAFMERVLTHPVEDDGDPLVDVREAARDAAAELDFSPTPHALGRPRLFLLRSGVVAPLLAAAAELRAIDHTLVIEDAFRTREMQRDLAVTDELLGQLVAALRRIEPAADAVTVVQRLAVVVAARPKNAGHMAGAAVDVSVRGPDGELLHRGGPYPTVSEKMPMASPFVSEEAARNRRFVADAMTRHGFVAYPYEFWHFSHGDAFDRILHDDPRPARYGPVDLLPDGRAVPAADQLDPLNEPDEIAVRVERLLDAHALR